MVRRAAQVRWWVALGGSHAHAREARHRLRIEIAALHDFFVPLRSPRTLLLLLPVDHPIKDFRATARLAFGGGRVLDMELDSYLPRNIITGSSLEPSVKLPINVRTIARKLGGDEVEEEVRMAGATLTIEFDWWEPRAIEERSAGGTDRWSFRFDYSSQHLLAYGTSLQLRCFYGRHSLWRALNRVKPLRRLAGLSKRGERTLQRIEVLPGPGMPREADWYVNQVLGLVRVEHTSVLPGSYVLWSRPALTRVVVQLGSLLGRVFTPLRVIAGHIPLPGR